MVKVIVGMMGSSVGGGSSSMASTSQCLNDHGVKELDTARVYAGGKSEELLGELQAHKQFAISTKAPAFPPKSLAEEKIIANCNASLEALGQKKVDISKTTNPARLSTRPRHETPLEDQCRAIGRLYSEGKFAKFGVSNISAAEVQKIHDICTQQQYPLPSIYQGAYNPIQRSAEVSLFPLLRKLNIKFYAFSPLAGGVLAKKIDDVLNPAPGTRFDAMKVFGDMYLKKPTFDALAVLKSRCDEEGIAVMEGTMRWLLHHSPLGEEDGVILGASNTGQINASLTACGKGPLDEGLVKVFEDLWVAIRNESSHV
ncbi:Oxidoreductase [Lachnellula occidentalis]|uniref:Oxidoreductase n=1 Tax=Lachnellula occidentalis TaxID=215460 RepID=A0A8H8UC27_9HELO|nr:Oxidoreductase [Lachnellula occidentalis]